MNKILRAGNHHEKEYIVTVNKPVTDEFIQQMGNGVPILGEMTKKCKLAKISVYVFRITLVQGLNRQIRRMCEYFGYEVVKLERVRIMNINIKGIALGEWRLLTEDEMTEITNAIEKSSSEVRPQNTKEALPKQQKKQKRQAPKTEEPEARKTGQRAPASSAAKKVIRSSVANPKARELRSNSSNSNKTGTAKHNKPSAGRPGNHRRSK